MQSLAVFVVLIFLIGAYPECQAQDSHPCDAHVRCSNEEAPVSATTNGQTCEVMRNGCYLFNANCTNYRENRPLYTQITREQCQELCREMVCLAVSDPVCGIYNDRTRTFGNDCEMARHVCTTQETYSLYRLGECPI